MKRDRNLGFGILLKMGLSRHERERTQCAVVTSDGLESEDH